MLNTIRSSLYAATPSGIRWSWLRHASLALFPKEFLFDLDELQDYVPSLAIVVPGMLSQVSPKDVGRFFATLERAAVFLMTFLLQHPIPEEIQRYCESMQNYLEMECTVCAALRDLNLRELMAFCEAKLEARRLLYPHTVIGESRLPPLNNLQAHWIAQSFIEPLTIEVLGSIAQFSIPICRSHMSFREFVEASRGYENGVLYSNSDVPLTYLGESDDAIASDMDDSLQPTGERVSLEDFCKPAESVPNGIACSVCMIDVDKDGKDEEKPVITKCAHYFHQVCLDSWVNESAMSGANSCPQCRAEMCQARAREPVPQLEDEPQEAENDEIIDSIQEEALYAEAKTDRGNDLFSRLRSRFRRR